MKNSTHARSAVLLALGLGFLSACGGGNGGNGPAAGSHTPTAKPKPPHGGVTGAAGKFIGMTLDKKTGWWIIPLGTDIASSYLPLSLGRVGTSLTFSISFKPVGAHRGMNGFGLKFFTDTLPGGTHVNDGYTAIVEATGFGTRISLYRQNQGKYVEMNDSRINGIVKNDDRWHTIKVVVTHADSRTLRFAGYVDNVLGVTGHDSDSPYTGGIWGPMNYSTGSNAFIDPATFRVTRGSATAPSTIKPAPRSAGRL